MFKHSMLNLAAILALQGAGTTTYTIQLLFIKYSIVFMATDKCWGSLLDLFIGNHRFINPMNKNVWHCYCMLGTVLGTGNYS